MLIIVNDACDTLEARVRLGCRMHRLTRESRGSRRLVQVLSWRCIGGLPQWESGWTPQVTPPSRPAVSTDRNRMGGNPWAKVSECTATVVVRRNRPAPGTKPPLFRARGTLPKTARSTLPVELRCHVMRVETIRKPSARLRAFEAACQYQIRERVSDFGGDHSTAPGWLDNTLSVNRAGFHCQSCGAWTHRGVQTRAGPFHSRILTGFGRARLLPSLFISPRLRTGSAGASPSRENETALRPGGDRFDAPQLVAVRYAHG